MAYSMPLWTILAKWPAPDLAGVDEPEVALGLERVEGRLHLRDVVVGAAAHQGVAVLQAPDAAGDAAVDEADALLGQQLGVHLVVGPLGVAAVDDQVALAEQLAERPHRLAGRVAGGHHHPHDLGGGQLLDHLLEAADVGDVGVAVVADHGVAGVAQPGAHVAAHLAEADESDVHVTHPTATVGSVEQAPGRRQESRRRGISR